MLHGERAPRSFAAQQLKPESMVNNALTTWPIICRCSNDSFLKSWAMNFSDLQQQDPDVLMDSPGDDEAMLPRLLSTIADLFASQLHHSPDEIQQFEAAVEGLLPHTSEDMRIKAASGSPSRAISAICARVRQTERARKGAATRPPKPRKASSTRGDR